MRVLELRVVYRLISNRVLHPDGDVRPGSLVVDGETIAEVANGARSGLPTLDFGNLLVLPGIIDLHGDAFERQILPRPAARFSHDIALLDTDRQMVANGITTAFHGVTYSWEPGLRGRVSAVEMLDAVERLAPRFGCDTYIHLRFEVFNIDGAGDVADWIDAGKIDLLGFNDHMGWILAKANTTRMFEYADRCGLTVEAFRALLDQVHERNGEVPEVVASLAAAAEANGIPSLSHDDETPEMRRHYHALGSRLCEFPVDEPTAQASRDLGDEVILGGPNVLRGGSHCNRLCAATAIADGLCTVLTSDYYYPSILHAPFLLADRGDCGLAEAWDLVSANPARGAGLTDRGTLAVGSRADIVAVDDSHQNLPHVAATIAGGRTVFRTEASGNGRSV